MLRSEGVLGATGNANVQERLLNYLKGGRINPAIILAGPERETKLTIAKNIAKYLLCPKKNEQTIFCGQCSTCRRIEKGLHPDVILYTGEEESIIKIDTIRQISHQMEVSPLEAQAKVCIMDECHRMPPPSANAFLKTLEEPLPNRYFWLLTTQVGSLLPTILSRCLQFYFKPESQSLTETDQKKHEKKLTELIKTGDLSSLQPVLSHKDKCLQFVQLLEQLLRQKIVNRLTQDPASATQPDSALFRTLEAFEDTIALEGRLRSNANYGLMLENLLHRHFIET